MRSLLRLRLHHRLAIIGSVVGLVIAAWLLLPAATRAAGGDGAQLQTQFGDSVFTDNLTVPDGMVYKNDVVVVSGNATVEHGGRIEGNLNVLSGNVAVEEGGEVEGDISAVSGNISVAGKVGGDIAAFSGNVELQPTAEVGGDISLVSGTLQRARGAQVEGEIVRGRGFPLPQLGSELRNDRPAGLVELSGSGVTFWGWLGGIILRLVLAVILTGVVVTLVALLHNIRPDLLRPVYATMRERTAFCFIIGVLVNLVLSILTTALFASILLCLGGFLTGAVLLGLNLVGWAVVSQYIGQRLMGYVQTPVRPLASTALGALLLTGVVALLWALGGCFQFFGFLLWLLASSVGVGAAVVRWLKLNGRPALPPPAMEELPPPPPPEGASPGGEPAAPFEAESAPAQAETNVLAELEGQQAQTPPPTSEFPSAEVTSPPTAEQPAVVEADFTVIRGIGPTFDRRLKSAGLKSFADLAALPPEELATIIGWTPQRVINDDLIGQARRLSEAMSS